jgi:glucose/arabinose dehydrogenase
VVVFGLLAGCGQAGNTSTTAPEVTVVTPVVPVTGNQQASPTAPLSVTQTPGGDPIQPTTTAIQAEATVEPTLPVTVMASIPDPAGYTWAQVASNLDRPIGMANAGDGSGRLFILEQAGRIRVIQNGSLLPGAFLDIVAKVGSGSSEQGLLCLAFHPDYPQNPHFYVNYTDKNGYTVISSFQVSGDPNQADPASEKVMIQVDQPFANHNGGSVVFGPDGYLYLGLGDGGSGGDPYGNGQSLDTLLGKILRIDVNQGDPYGIPPDNPFAAGGGKPEIWAYGLRNPWRFSFDRQTHDLFIADVGQNTWEEVDYVPADSPGGANFGWNFREGAHPYADVQPPAGVTLIDPIFPRSMIMRRVMAPYSRSSRCSMTSIVTP